MDKRVIQPHKGGRTEHAPRARLTEDERKRLEKVLNRTGETMADWIARHIEMDEELDKKV